MAVGPKPVLSNGLASPQSIWEAPTTQQHAIGTRGTLDDGRVFYYGRHSDSTAIAAGEIVACETTSAQFVGLATNTAAVGDKTVTLTLGSVAVTANEYDGGYVVADDGGTGEGITYKIASHPAASASTSCVVTLVDPINVAFAAGTTATLIKNPWSDFIQMPAAGSQVSMCVGGSNVAITDSSSTSKFVWIQTWGMFAGERDDTSGLGLAVGQGTTAGQLEAVSTTDTEPHYAICLATGVVNGHQPVFLTVAP